MIEADRVSKVYKLYAHGGDRLKELAFFNRRRCHTEHRALDEVSFSIERGETFCILGENGSGKSTLLQIVAGIMQPTSGTVSVHGRVNALLELGSGFNAEFTGRENVLLNGAILGMSATDVASRLDDIIRFASIGEFIDQPVRTYSSGMTVRLAFAVAVHLDPDILIVDEALAVGDIGFRQRCMRRIHEMRARGVTIVYVTHDTSDVRAIGHRALWLERGRPVELGDAREVALHYMAAMVEKDAARREQEHKRTARVETRAARAPQVIEGLTGGLLRHGDRRAEILGVAVTDDRGRALDETTTPRNVVVRVSVRTHDSIMEPIVGIVLRTEAGTDFAGTNTLREDMELPSMAAGEVHTFDFHLALPELKPGCWTFTPAMADGTLVDYRFCDVVENAATLRIMPARAIRGLVGMPCLSVSVAPFSAGA